VCGSELIWWSVSGQNKQVDKRSSATVYFGRNKGRSQLFFAPFLFVNHVEKRAKRLACKFATLVAGKRS
jgi:hypothetical protein